MSLPLLEEFLFSPLRLITGTVEFLSTVLSGSLPYCVKYLEETYAEIWRHTNETELK